MEKENGIDIVVEGVEKEEKEIYFSKMGKKMEEKGWFFGKKMWV